MDFYLLHAPQATQPTHMTVDVKIKQISSYSLLTLLPIQIFSNCGSIMSQHANWCSTVAVSLQRKERNKTKRDNKSIATGWQTQVWQERERESSSIQGSCWAAEEYLCHTIQRCERNAASLRSHDLFEVKWLRQQEELRSVCVCVCIREVVFLADD